jgi:hypothetical protein
MDFSSKSSQQINQSLVERTGIRINNTTISPKTPKNVTVFFVLTFVFTTPIYILAIFVPDMEAAAAFLFVFAPMISALILTF